MESFREKLNKGCQKCLWKIYRWFTQLANQHRGICLLSHKEYPIREKSFDTFPYLGIYIVQPIRLKQWNIVIFGQMSISQSEHNYVIVISINCDTLDIMDHNLAVVSITGAMRFSTLVLTLGLCYPKTFMFSLLTLPLPSLIHILSQKIGKTNTFWQWNEMNMIKYLIRVWVRFWAMVKVKVTRLIPTLTLIFTVYRYFTLVI